MAIIRCPECGHNISDEAFFCPYCGCTSIQEKREQNIGAGLIFAAVVGFLAFATFAPPKIATIVVPIIMAGIGILIKNRIGKILFICWAILTFLVNVENLL